LRREREDPAMRLRNEAMTCWATCRCPIDQKNSMSSCCRSKQAAETPLLDVIGKPPGGPPYRGVQTPNVGPDPVAEPLVVRCFGDDIDRGGERRHQYLVLPHVAGRRIDDRHRFTVTEPPATREGRDAQLHARRRRTLSPKRREVGQRQEAPCFGPVSRLSRATAR